jgi:hypothetical protein
LRRGARCDIHVDGPLLRFIGDDLVKTAARTSNGEVRRPPEQVVCHGDLACSVTCSRSGAIAQPLSRTE